MKKFLLAVSALLVVGTNAQAETRKSALAQLTQRPITHMNRPGPLPKVYKQVVIYADGEVYGYACNRRVPCPAYKLAKLTAKQIDAVEVLVEGAREGEMKDNGPVFCLAIPNQAFEYTADNGVVTLKSGSAPCGHVGTNQSEEAAELIKKLDGYMAKLAKKLAPVEAE